MTAVRILSGVDCGLEQNAGNSVINKRLFAISYALCLKSEMTQVFSKKYEQQSNFTRIRRG